VTIPFLSKPQQIYKIGTKVPQQIGTIIPFFPMHREEWKAIAVLFGENVHRIRKERGITQLDLAVAVGVDQKTIVNIEKGRKITSIGVAALIARELGVALGELVGG
jgi:DNA-binding XRE family transcriptional regulator